MRWTPSPFHFPNGLEGVGLPMMLHLGSSQKLPEHDARSLPFRSFDPSYRPTPFSSLEAGHDLDLRSRFLQSFEPTSVYNTSFRFDGSSVCGSDSLRFFRLPGFLGPEGPCWESKHQTFEGGMALKADLRQNVCHWPFPSHYFGWRRRCLVLVQGSNDPRRRAADVPGRWTGIPLQG